MIKLYGNDSYLKDRSLQDRDHRGIWWKLNADQINCFGVVRDLGFGQIKC